MEEHETQKVDGRGGPPIPEGHLELPLKDIAIRCWRWVKSKVISLGRGLKAQHAMINDYVQVVAILGAGVWAFYTFIYIEKIKPANESPTLAVSASLENAGRKELEGVGEKVSLMAIKATVTAKNTSKAHVAIMGAYFNVKGYKIEPYLPTKEEEYRNYVGGRLALNGEMGDTTVSRYDKHESQPGTVVHSSNLLQGWTMDPEDQYSRTTIFYIPNDTEHSYDFLEIQFHLYLARDAHYTKDIYKQWQVGDDGRITARFFVKRGGQPCDANEPATNCDPFEPQQNKAHLDLLIKYGITHYDEISTLSLWKSSSPEQSTGAASPP